MTRSRRTFTAQEKAADVKRYLVGKIPVSELCDEVVLSSVGAHSGAAHGRDG